MLRHTISSRPGGQRLKTGLETFNRTLQRPVDRLGGAASRDFEVEPFLGVEVQDWAGVLLVNVQADGDAFRLVVRTLNQRRTTFVADPCFLRGVLSDVKCRAAVAANSATAQ